MIDFHSHILPGIDDGSRHAGESAEMLRRLAAQGVRCVVATPHFFANHESVPSFLERRTAAYAQLQSALPAEAPEIRLGAEVRYYPGIGRLRELRDLQIQDSNLLLLEMDINRWTEYTVRELVDITNAGIVPVLAHVERYIGYQSGQTVRRLLDSGILMQVNATFLTRQSSRRKALSMFKRGQVHFVGSDCHNLTDRPPEIGAAYEVMGKKLGSAFVRNFVAYGSDLLML